MFTSSSGSSRALYAVWGVLRQPLFDCFGLEPSSGDCGKGTIPDAHFALSHFRTYTSAEFLRYILIYTASILGHLFDLPGAVIFWILALLTSMTLDAHSTNFYYIAFSFVCPAHLRRTASPSLLECGRRPLAPPPPPPDATDICLHCASETSCSLSKSHALGPCPCPNDHRFVEQTTSSAWHSLYCAKCHKHCFVCVGTSDIPN
ncbi:hypothetical protein C8R45DRAFT_1025797 [Mycena sanguinolenta]|nr:hypothetical protein C8R45DRAFT_1025797 [Mycena sanguinolenta]